ncbi:MAG: hypothetical protein HOO96_19420, partial [Polyangiaceae bacterium]|nr:hypothetical protein [Polyangiaceae bacterium]
MPELTPAVALEAGPSPRRKRAWEWAGRAALAFLGIGAIVAMVRLAGSDSVGRVGALAAPWLPLVLAL